MCVCVRARVRAAAVYVPMVCAHVCLELLLSETA